MASRLRRMNFASRRPVRGDAAIAYDPRRRGRRHRRGAGSGCFGAWDRLARRRSAICDRSGFGRPCRLRRHRRSFGRPAAGCPLRRARNRPDGAGIDCAASIRQSPPRNGAVLVTAAASGVGSLLVQLAKAAGASQVIALASSPEKLALASGLGADAGVDYTRRDWPAQVRNATGGVGPISPMTWSAAPSPPRAGRRWRLAESSFSARWAGFNCVRPTWRTCCRRTSR